MLEASVGQRKTEWDDHSEGTPKPHLKPCLNIPDNSEAPRRQPTPQRVGQPPTPPDTTDLALLAGPHSEEVIGYC